MAEAVNDTLKAIAASLLMEQVLAPRFEFKPKHPENMADEGFDYGDGGYDPSKCNIGFNEETGRIQVEIKGLSTPKSPEAQRICADDINEVITAFVQDTDNIAKGMFDHEAIPEELTQVRMGKIVKEKYPDLDKDDLEAVREHAVAAFNIIQKSKEALTTDSGPTENVALIKGVRKFAMDVRELDIDMIDRINPFEQAYAIMAKTMNPERLKDIANIIMEKRISLDLDDARELAKRAVAFKNERGRAPALTSTDPWEKRMAEGVAYLQQQVRRQKDA